VSCLAYEKEHVSIETPDVGQDGGGEIGEADAVSLNQFIAAAVAEKVGVIETARELLERRAGKRAQTTCSGTCARLAASGRRNQTVDSGATQAPKLLPRCYPGARAGENWISRPRGLAVCVDRSGSLQAAARSEDQAVTYM
jgi:hypothetical protein